MKKLTTLAVLCITSIIVFSPAANAAQNAGALVRCLETKLGFVKGKDFRVLRTGGRTRAGVKIGGQTKVQLANAVRNSSALMRKVINRCPN